MRVGELVPLFVAAGLLRVALIGVAALQDWLAEVPYTDVDYRVITEAAESVSKGVSPYEGRTALLARPETRYRYTPLLAFLLLPNIWFHPVYGKILFSALDLVAAGFLARWLRAHTYDRTIVWWGVASLLFNPYIFTISTRGSSESVVVLILYGMLDALHFRSGGGGGIPVAACLFGLAVHIRLYPVIYIVPIMLSLGRKEGRRGLRCLTNKALVHLAVISGGVVLVLTMAFYLAYGFEFVHASYLYHTQRVDTQHNFSIYFYPMRWFPGLARLATFPQLLCVVALGMTGARAGTPVLGMLMQTVGFVALNRVITAQYFVWWLALLPPCLPWLVIDSRLAWSLALWVVAEVHWLLWAYLLEFRRLEVAAFVWLASCAFLAAEGRLLSVLLRTGQSEDRRHE